MPTIKRITSKFWQACGEKGTLAPLVTMQIGTAAIENTMEVPQKLKLQLPHDPAISLLIIYPKKMKTLI